MRPTSESSTAKHPVGHDATPYPFIKSCCCRPLRLCLCANGAKQILTQIDRDVIKLQVVLTNEYSQFKRRWDDRNVTKLQLTSINIVKVANGTARRFRTGPRNMTEELL